MKINHRYSFFIVALFLSSTLLCVGQNERPLVFGGFSIGAGSLTEAGPEICYVAKNNWSATLAFSGRIKSIAGTTGNYYNDNWVGRFGPHETAQSYSLAVGRVFNSAKPWLRFHPRAGLSFGQHRYPGKYQWVYSPSGEVLGYKIENVSKSYAGLWLNPRVEFPVCNWFAFTCGASVHLNGRINSATAQFGFVAGRVR